MLQSSSFFDVVSASGLDFLNCKLMYIRLTLTFFGEIACTICARRIDECVERLIFLAFARLIDCTIFCRTRVACRRSHGVCYTSNRCLRGVVVAMRI